MGICTTKNKNYNEEKIPIGQIKPIPRAAHKIIDKQLANYICKIYSNKKKGTGFLCLIPYPEIFKTLPVLINNKHILNKDEIKNKKIKITFDDDKLENYIDITSERKIYNNEKYDIAIIEIFPEKDNLKYFLEIDNSFENYKEYKNEPLYILQYPYGDKCCDSYGTLIDINEYNIIYNCSTVKGSSGGLILLLNTFKVVGVHKGSSNDYNCGTLLKYPILEFNSKFGKANGLIKSKLNF